MTALISGVVVIVLVLGMTSQGHAIDASVQRFMLYYAGVFALMGLTASVGVGLVATDRIILTPGRRVMAQAVHRAVSFGALAFLIVHIVTEILAQRVHVIDGFVPFLSPFRTFYIGLGTIASDLILLLVVTSIIRKRFTAHRKAWRWRAIHYSAYLAFVFGVLHGLLGGRTGKPYVDWSYGAAIALTALGVGVRFLAISLRPKETLSAPPAGGKNTSPLHAATLTMAQAQLGGTIRSLPAAPAMQLPVGSGYGGVGGPGGPGYGAYGDGAFTPLGAPPFGDAMPTYPYQQPALASLPAPPAETRQPLYEPGYIGPPRYAGAPRADTGPMPRTAIGPMPRTATGPMPRVDSGPMPRLGSGPRPGTGPMPRADTGPMPRAGTGPMPRAGTGPMPRMGTGPMPQAGTGPMPQPGSGPMPQLPPRGGPPPGDQRRPPRQAADGRKHGDWQERDRPRRGGDGWR